MKEKVLMKGNEALAEAAIRSGCRFYFGYPITPQNEITEYMSRELPKAGGSFVQAESEVAAINMAYGGGVSGGRVLISSSSPGIALMQEGFSYLASTEIPLVIINISRGGPGLGTIQPGQADYFQATRGGGNGDYHLIVLAPCSIQEAVNMMEDAYTLADEYRNPVMILADGVIGQMMEPVMLPDPIEPVKPSDISKKKPWALTGHGDKRSHNVVKSLYLKPELLEARVHEINKKYIRAKKELPKHETYNLKGAKVVLVAYGITARIAKDAIGILEKDGIKAGLIRPITLWPFPYDAFDEIDEMSTKALVSVELSLGQLIDDIKIGSKCKYPISLSSKVGGIIISPQEIATDVKNALEVI